MSTAKTLVTFGVALEAAKQGKLIAREGWNGKGMFVFQRPSDELDRGFIIDTVRSLPQSVKDYYKKQEEHDFTNPVDCKIKFSAYLCMKAADGSIVNGWLASTSDILSEDWYILD
jgi:hypothetical protein